MNISVSACLTVCAAFGARTRFVLSNWAPNARARALNTAPSVKVTGGTHVIACLTRSHANFLVIVIRGTVSALRVDAKGQYVLACACCCAATRWSVLARDWADIAAVHTQRLSSADLEIMICTCHTVALANTVLIAAYLASDAILLALHALELASSAVNAAYLACCSLIVAPRTQKAAVLFGIGLMLARIAAFAYALSCLFVVSARLAALACKLARLVMETPRRARRAALNLVV